MEKNKLTIIILNESEITDFAAVRNAKLSTVKTEWVLFLDQDEQLSPDLKLAIDAAINNGQYDAYYLKRLDLFLGRQLLYGETGKAKFIRLAKRDFGKWVRPVHEVWEGKGRIGVIQSPILHNPHSSISSFLEKINRYSTIEAEYRYNLGMKSSLVKIAFYPLGKFVVNFIFKLGFFDGLPGCIMAIMMSFHSYLTWTKLYLLWHKK